MLFSTVQFFIFLPAVLALFYGSPRVLRKWILLVASYYFYASWNWKFIPLLLTLTVIDYTAGLWIARVRPSRKKLLLIMSICANLGFLGFFKYYNFLAGNLAQVLDMPLRSFALDIVLPLGISFHTFQSMSYVVDVYRGEQKAVSNPLDYALFICFFPQLVAGPIVRARNFFRDLGNWKRPSREDVARGVLLIALGLTKKMAFADQLAKVVDAYFKNVAGQAGALTAWSAATAFVLQVYFDFSGYTDIAIGSAKLLGFHFPANFTRPFLASNMSDFWRRWHISFSKWLRDYVYLPLCQNRRGEAQVYVSLMITMTLGGLWHGASWNFVIWGAYFGVLLCAERFWRKWRKRRMVSADPVWMHALKVAFTFALFVLGSPFFRAASLGDAIHVIGQMFTGTAGPLLLQTWHLELLGISLGLAVAEEKLRWFEKAATGPTWAYTTALTLMLLCLELFAVTEVSVPFVYFQF